MSTNFLLKENFWWVPIVVVLLSGLGYLIQKEVENKNKNGILIGTLVNPPNVSKAYLHDNDFKVNIHHETGFFRINEIPRGEIIVICEANGYIPQWGKIDIKGGKINRIKLPSLRVLKNASPKKTIKTTQHDGSHLKMKDEAIRKEKSFFLSSMADEQLAAAMLSGGTTEMTLLYEAKENYTEALTLMANDAALIKKLADVQQQIIRIL